MLALPIVLLLHLQAAAPTDAQLRSDGVFALDDAAFVEQAQSDLARLRQYANGLRRVQEQLKESRGLFNHKDAIPYTPEQKRTLLTAWAAMFDYFLSCEVLRQRYWGFVKLPLKTESQKVRHAWGYLLTHGALTTELAHGMVFADLSAGRPQLEVLLDEPAPEYGIPERAFAVFKSRVIHVSTSTQLVTGDAWLPQVRPLLSELGLREREDVRWVLQEMALNSKVAKGRLLKRGVNLFVKNAVDIAKDTASAGIFPVQRSVAEWMGDTRVKRKNQPLISREQVLELIQRMEPGDIVVARQNWYLSNIGLPGFWPHAELYLGPREAFSAFFDEDPEVKAWLATLPGKPETLGAHLAEKYPEKWAAFGGRDEHGDPIRIMESISEGVAFTGIEHGLRVDYVGVMRPRLTKVDKAKAMVRAFGYQGRPYDFNFDFFSDAALVCTELVFKSYMPSKNVHGIRIALVDVAGRRTLPANEYVRLFDEEFGRPDRQLDFVAFLDGREDLKGAFLNDVEAFRRSYGRLKWDIAQK